MAKPLSEDLGQFSLNVLIATAYALFSALTLTAQPARSDDDAKALLLEAAQRNGLAREGMKPWHLKVSFTSYDENGKDAEQGTIEEFWEGPTRYKVVRTNASGSQTDYGTDTGIFRSGRQDSLPRIYTEVSEGFIAPISVKYVQGLPSSASVEMQKLQVGQSNLRCLTVTLSATSYTVVHELRGPPTCLDWSVPALRILGTLISNRQYDFNDVESFQNNYVARSIQETRGNKKEFVARIDVLEELNDINSAELTPPPEAVPVKMPVRISPAVAQRMQIKTIAPEYPLAAKAQRITGTVVFEIVIDKGGHVSDVRVVGGPPLLQQAGADAVRRWTYKPYILNGEAVEVITSAAVTFALDGHN